MSLSFSSSSSAFSITFFVGVGSFVTFSLSFVEGLLGVDAGDFGATEGVGEGEDGLVRMEGDFEVEGEGEGDFLATTAGEEVFPLGEA